LPAPEGLISLDKKAVFLSTASIARTVRAKEEKMNASAEEEALKHKDEIAVEHHGAELVLIDHVAVNPTDPDAVMDGWSRVFGFNARSVVRYSEDWTYVAGFDPKELLGEIAKAVRETGRLVPADISWPALGVVMINDIPINLEDPHLLRNSDGKAVAFNRKQVVQFCTESQEAIAFEVDLD